MQSLLITIFNWLCNLVNFFCLTYLYTTCISVQVALLSRIKLLNHLSLPHSKLGSQIPRLSRYISCFFTYIDFFPLSNLLLVFFLGRTPIDWDTDISSLEGQEIIVETREPFAIQTNISHNFVSLESFVESLLAQHQIRINSMPNPDCATLIANYFIATFVFREAIQTSVQHLLGTCIGD